MVRSLGVVLMAGLALSAAAGSAEQRRLTKEQYVAAVEHATDGLAADRLLHQVVDFEMQGKWPPSRTAWLQAEQRLRSEIERLADRLASLDAPLDVAEVHAAWVATLRICAAQFGELESASPLDSVIVTGEMKPCFDAYRKVCERLYARNYSFG
jgi:hypothetical protein